MVAVIRSGIYTFMVAPDAYIHTFHYEDIH